MGYFDKLTQPMFYVLLSLYEERHGYEIMNYIKELTKERVIVGPGTLYNLLGRFLDEGYIDIISEKDNKKIYIINDSGKRLVDREIKRLKKLIEDANNVFKGDEYE
ncbi:PadR family transcriptional regulator [Senegalia sp. (in: firmicutes)]|uniref:PadR family transcriptional regulator n=1 Tax=Senegalia sp. (in: firmicutes) TaxID=1924098 RepID=UPI003F95039B